MYTPIEDPTGWNNLISSLPDPHILQSWEWGEVKNQFGWLPTCYQWHSPGTAACLVLERSISIAGVPFPLRILYAPKGPLLDWQHTELLEQVLDDLHQVAKDRKAIFIKIDPDITVESEPPLSGGINENAQIEPIATALLRRGWRYSQDQIQFRNTVLLDLRAPDEELLKRMKPKSRYNIRLAERKGVKIRQGNEDDYPLLYRMYAETSIRDGFAIREEGYYQAVWKTFSQQGMAESLIAEVDHQPVAALVLFTFANKAWFLYGMSSSKHREKMPNYLLQWEAMRRARERGCQVYDLWGAPDKFDESDPLWGVYRFKIGLGGQTVQTIGAWDLPVQSLLYKIYTQTLPRILDKMRQRGFQRTRESLT